MRAAVEERGMSRVLCVCVCDYLKIIYQDDHTVSKRVCRPSVRLIQQQQQQKKHKNKKKKK